MTQRVRGITCLLLASVLMAAAPHSGTAETGDRETAAVRTERVLVIGKVSDNPKKHYGYLKPMVDYVAGHMKDLGVTRGEVLMAPSNEVMIQYLREGRIDWVTETPFSAVVFEEEAGARFLLRKWKKGVPEYKTLIFTRVDSGIETLEGLRGKTIAFEDAGSSSAFYIPASMLIQAGLRLVRLNTPKDSVPHDAVGYVFSNEEINSSTWVYRGLVDAAAFNDLDWEKEDHVPKDYHGDLQVIARSDQFIRAVEVVRADLEPEIESRLREVLLAADKDPRAAAALHAYQKTTKFDEITDAMVGQLRTIRSLLRLVQSETAE